MDIYREKMDLITTKNIPEMYKQSVETYKSGSTLNQNFALEIKI